MRGALLSHAKDIFLESFSAKPVVKCSGDGNAAVRAAWIFINDDTIYAHNVLYPLQVRPSIVDDFIRNFLIKVGMTRTLDSFNTEWYELQAKGRLGEEYTTKVPDIYLRNEELDEQAGVA